MVNPALNPTNCAHGGGISICCGPLKGSAPAKVIEHAVRSALTVKANFFMTGLLSVGVTHVNCLAQFPQSAESFSIDLSCSRNSLGSLWPCAEQACCTAASSTSSSVPDIFSVQPLSLG